MAKHREFVAGSWEALPHAPGENIYIRSRLHGFFLAEVYSLPAFPDIEGDEDKEERTIQMAEEHAHAIAAVPDLLAACELAQPLICASRCPTVWKAGQPQPHCRECTTLRAVIAKARGENAPHAAQEVRDA